MKVQCTPPAMFCRDLLIAPLGELRRNCRQVAEEASRFLVRTGGEVDLRCRCIVGIEIGGADISWLKRPDALNDDGLAARILKESVELARHEIVGSNDSGRLGVAGIRKLSDKQVMAKTSKVERSQSHTPRHIQP